MGHHDRDKEWNHKLRLQEEENNAIKARTMHPSFDFSQAVFLEVYQETLGCLREAQPSELANMHDVPQP